MFAKIKKMAFECNAYIRNYLKYRIWSLCGQVHAGCGCTDAHAFAAAIPSITITEWRPTDGITI